MEKQEGERREVWGGGASSIKVNFASFSAYLVTNCNLYIGNSS